MYLVIIHFLAVMGTVNMVQLSRKVLSIHDLLSTRPFQSPFQPFVSIFALILLVLFCLNSGYQAFFPGYFSAASFLAAYLTLPLFLVLYFGYKIFHTTPWIRPVEDTDVFIGTEEATRLKQEYQAPTPKNGFERAWFWRA